MGEKGLMQDEATNNLPQTTSLGDGSQEAPYDPLGGLSNLVDDYPTQGTPQEPPKTVERDSEPQSGQPPATGDSSVEAPETHIVNGWPGNARAYEKPDDRDRISDVMGYTCYFDKNGFKGVWRNGRWEDYGGKPVDGIPVDGVEDPRFPRGMTFLQSFDEDASDEGASAGWAWDPEKGSWLRFFEGH